MKIRNGFVSNSSSSSFIISTECFPTVRSLATYMLKQKINEYQHDPDVEFKKLDKLYIKRLKKIDENQAVSFPSCNYDTYIKKVGDCYLVSTCNNTDWDLWEYTTRLTEQTKEELNELKKYFTDKGDNDALRQIEYIFDHDSDFSLLGNDYYDLRKEIIGVETYEDCPKKDRNNPNDSHQYYDYMWDTAKYGKICLICNPYYKRKDKLIEINKSVKNNNDGAI